MTFMQMAGLGVRLFALWVLLFSFQVLSNAIAFQDRLPGAGMWHWLNFAPAAICFALALFLWRFPLAVARMLVPRGAEKGGSVSIEEAWRIGCVLIGFLVLSNAAPSLLRLAIVIFTNYNDSFSSMEPALKAALIEAVAKTAMALFLILWNRQIYARFVRDAA
jgi:hypothetical protein